MKKDKMLERIIDMTVKLTKYELHEHVEKVEAANKEAEKWLDEYRKRDNMQLEKNIALCEERNEWQAKAQALEAELAALRGES